MNLLSLFFEIYCESGIIPLKVPLTIVRKGRFL